VSSIGRALILMNSNPNPITDITVSSIGRTLILMNSNPNPITREVSDFRHFVYILSLIVNQ
jgi:hypothetical protein